eukprot:14337841-Ditylum_brightwellii.AAC.1
MQDVSASIFRRCYYHHRHYIVHSQEFYTCSLFPSIKITTFSLPSHHHQQQWTRLKTSFCSKKGHARRGTKKQTGGNTPSSKAWLLRQSKDEYAHRARKEGSPSRAIYKLEQIDESKRKHLFQTGNVVVDLG